MALNIVYRKDLTHTRAEGDRKEYRLIKLRNGLECMLVSTFSEQQQMFRRPSSGITEEQEEKLRKISIHDRRFTNFEQSRSVRTFSEERLIRKSDASHDSHQKFRSDSKELEEPIEEGEEEGDDVIGRHKNNVQHSPNIAHVRSSRLSLRESSSKASGGHTTSLRSQSRAPSITGIVSGEAGRKLSQIFPPPPADLTSSAPPTPNVASRSNSVAPPPGPPPTPSNVNSSTTAAPRLGRTSIIESPRERPPALRLSRMLSTGHEFAGPHSHLTSEQLVAPGSNDFGNPSVVGTTNTRTHRTSIRSNSLASSRAMSMVYPTQSEPDMCAVSMAVAIGSFATPEGLDGLAHFLEHMLFMGSERYPKENEFDSILARAGGSSNAYTDTERTVYHFSVPQSHLKECLRVFSQFFVSPLLLPEAAIRELRSIESEFALRQNIDGCRLQEIWRETSRPDTPYSKFTCGNMQTLKEIPESKGIDVNFALREFYEKYYVSENMKFVIFSNESMNELEQSVSEILKDVRSSRTADELDEVNDDDDDDDYDDRTLDSKNIYHLSIANFGFPWKRYNPFSSSTLSSTTHHSSTKNLPPSPKTRSASSSSTASNTTIYMPGRVEPGTAVGCCFRIPPTQDIHELQMTWQIPSQAQMYKSKPTEFLAHALGHESAGSILAELKSRGWATALVAGVSPEDGFTNNSGVTLFNVTIALTSVGLSQWIFVSGLVFEFIGILKRIGPVKWIHDELAEVAMMQYRFHEEPDARWMAQRLCIHMLPQTGYEKDHLLSGSSLVFEWRPEDILQVLDRLEPESVRIDLISSRLHDPVNADANPTATAYQEDFARLTHCQQPNRPAILEKYTGAPYWVDPIPQPVLYSWRAVYTGKSTVGYAGMTGEELFPKSLSLPPRNPFISSDFRLKTIRQYDYSSHFLIHAELRIRSIPRGEANSSVRHISFGPKSRKSFMGWDIGVVIAFDKENDSILVKYPAKEGVRRWHRIDNFNSLAQSDFQKSKTFFMDNARTLARLTSTTSTTTDLKAIQKREDYDEVTDLYVSASPDGKNAALWNSFPRVPLSETCPAPTLICGSDDFFSLWFLHDTTFRSPRVSAYLNFLTPIVTESALNAALADLFAVLVFESLNQESYMAFIVDLDFEIQVTCGLGLQLHFSGFSHKLPDLLKIVLRRTFFFTQWVTPNGAPVLPSKIDPKRKSTAGGMSSHVDSVKALEEENEFESFFLAPDQDAPRDFDTPLFYARWEALLTDYINAGSRFRSGTQVSSVLFDLLCDGLWTTEEKALAARSITPQMLIDFSNKIFATTKVEGLFQGNVDEKDASQFFRCIDAALRVRGSKPIRPGNEPKLRSQIVPVVSERNQPVSGWIHILEAVESPSHSVELFFQIGPDNPEERVLASALEQLMREPLYTELRTKQQLGYSVKCGVRSVCGTLGFVVEITSDVHGPEVLAADVDEFFTKFKVKLEQMPQDEYILNLCGLASQFLEKAKNLGEAATRHWNCILSHVFYGLPYVWNSNVVDAALIKAVATKSRVLDAFTAWLDPVAGKRRRASVYVVGYGYQVDKLVKALRKPCVKLVTHPHGNVGNTLSFGMSHQSTGGVKSSDSSRRSSVKCSIM